MNGSPSLLDRARLTAGLLAGLRRYLPILFVLLTLGIYGYLLYQTQVLNNRGPDTSLAPSQTAQVPHIDPHTLSQLKSLQDNSVSVQTLFSGARSNPFKE